MVDIVGTLVVVGSLAAGVASLALAQYLRRHRGEGGANWFIGSLIFQSLWALAYGGGLLITASPWRAYAEALSWIGMVWVGPLFLGFTLAYTGRLDATKSTGFRALFVFPVAMIPLALTHPLHDLLWTGFREQSVFGLSTVLYTVQPAGYLVAGIGTLAAGVGVLLLADAVLSYGPLYRREAIAVALSTGPPTVALTAWLFGLGPLPALNLTPLSLLPHVALDAYAFVGTHMFTTSPTTQRAADQSGLDAIKDPVLTIDTADQVVDLNDRAQRLFEVDSRGALPTPLADLTGRSLTEMQDAGEIRLDGSDGGVFVVSYTPLTDVQGDPVGGILVLSDITEERQQQQQLSVLNRVLRHNLRNEMTVVRAHGQMLAEGIDDQQFQQQADTIVTSSQNLVTIAEKVREFDRAQQRDPHLTAVDLQALIEEVIGDLQTQYPDATITHTGQQTTAQTDPGLLRLILENLVENAVLHAEDAGPAVRIDAGIREREPGGKVLRLAVTDSNPRIAEGELAPLREGDESALSHGSGIGLWIVLWCTRALSGDISFEYDEGNRIVVELSAE